MKDTLTVSKSTMASVNFHLLWYDWYRYWTSCNMANLSDPDAIGPGIAVALIQPFMDHSLLTSSLSMSKSSSGQNKKF